MTSEAGISHGPSAVGSVGPISVGTVDITLHVEVVPRLRVSRRDQSPLDSRTCKQSIVCGVIQLSRERPGGVATTERKGNQP